MEIFDAYPDGILLLVYVMYHGPAAHTTDKTACTAYPSVRPESCADASRGDLGTLDRPRPDPTPPPSPHPQRHPLTERREIDLVDLYVVRPIR